MFEEENQLDQTEPTTEEVETPDFTEDNDMEESNEEVENETPTVPEAPTSFLNVKFNGEEKSLSQEEAIALAQKGMNYDTIHSKYEEMKNNSSKFDKANHVLESFAKRSGLSVEQYLDSLEKEDLKIQAQEAAKKYGITDPQLAADFYAMKQKIDNIEKDEIAKKAEEEKQAGIKKSFIDLADYFKSEYGRVIEPTKDIPESVFKMAEEQNVSILTAFKFHELDQLKTSKKIETKNQENSNASTGSITENSIDADDAYTEEKIENMSVSELAKHMDDPKLKKFLGMK